MTVTRPTVLGIIPARGGSKRLPRKNVMLLRGKSVISYTIDAALGAKHLSRVIVTTDDDEIAAAAQESGAEMPFRRPHDLADDFTTVGDVACHAVTWLEEHEGYLPEYVVVLQPSSPLRTAAHIDGAVEQCVQSSADGVMSVCEPDYHPYWMQHQVEGRLEFYQPEGQRFQRKQELPPVFRPNGAIYAYRREVLLRQGDLGRQGLLCLTVSHRILAYVMERADSPNIDNEIDLQMAEFFLKLRDAGGKTAGGIR